LIRVKGTPVSKFTRENHFSPKYRKEFHD